VVASAAGSGSVATIEPVPPATDPELAPDLAPADAGVPRHVAIIMDGNRRWARERGVADVMGHAAGVDAIRPILEQSLRRGVEILSLFAFSRENWLRDRNEVEALFGLLDQALRERTPELVEEGVRVNLIGRIRELDAVTRASIEEALRATAGGTRITLNVCFNYSGRMEIVDAARRCVEDGLSSDEITEEHIAERLYTAGFPDVDLLIRTGREQRVSNFLIWQAAYAELYFSDRYWPDFDPDELDAAIAEYARRSRRFGR
jgi:undecaprenyl diphosphate synthase